MKRTFVFVLLIGLVPSLLRCGDKRDLVVAEVGERKITLRELEETSAKLPGAETMTKTKILWALIDKELLVMEARNKGLDKDEQIVAELEKREGPLMLEEFTQRIASQVEVSEEEVRRYFEESKIKSNLEVRASHIMVETREEAEEILKALAEGADFARLAEERSLDRATAEKGGDLGYWEQGVVKGASAQKVFSMKVGALSEPFRDPGGYYHIFQKFEERPVGFEKQQPKIRNILRRRKIRERRAEVLEKLRKDLKLEIVGPTLHFLLEEGRPDMLSELAAEDRAKTLLRYDGGQVSLGQYLSWLQDFRMSRRFRRSLAAGDSVEVVRFLEDSSIVLPEVMRRAGIAGSKEMQARLTAEKEKRMVTELRRREVEKKVINEETLRGYYEAHLEDYFEEETITTEGILISDKKKLQEIREKIEKGADMAELARGLPRLSQRTRNYGILRFHPSEESYVRLGQVVWEAQKAKVGELRGPLKTSFGERGQSFTGYGLFRVLAKEKARQKNLDDPGVRRSVERRLRIEKVGEVADLFKHFLAQLREKYAGQITVYEKNLDAVSVSHEGTKERQILSTK